MVLASARVDGDNTSPMETSLFDFSLPEGRIAAHPSERREDAKMLRLRRATGRMSHKKFSDLPSLLNADDLLVVNNSRVFPARLYGKRAATGGKVEALLLRPAAGGYWLSLVRPGKKIGEGETLVFGDGRLKAEVVKFGGKGERLLRFDCPTSELADLLEEVGAAPLPPYILRERRRLMELKGETVSADGLEEEEDKERYQTVYAGPRGSVAAPTAGLHFSDELLNEIRDRGHDIVELTLHVGAGTFKPMTTRRVEDHIMHREDYTLSGETAAAINRARSEGRRVVAVGTTTVRVLESLSRKNSTLKAASGSTDLMICPGFEFKAVDAMITNFHLPKSTLMMLVSAFGGRAFVMRAYDEAISKRYAFYSYGDAMLID